MCYHSHMTAEPTPSPATAAIEAALHDAFADAADRVAAVYLFGSVAAGRDHARSDVDVAVLYRDGYVPDGWARLELIADLSLRLGREVDVAVLNDASPILGMQVLRNGRRLMTFDERRVNRFFVDTVNQYADLKIVRRPIERALGRELDD